MSIVLSNSKDTMCAAISMHPYKLLPGVPCIVYLDCCYAVILCPAATADAGSAAHRHAACMQAACSGHILQCIT